MKAYSIGVILFLVTLLACYGSLALSCSNHETPPGPDSGVAYLDRHKLTCPSGKLLNQFKLHRPSSNQMSYRYTCCVPGESDHCYTKLNAETKAGNVNFLDRQNIDCGSGYLLYSHQFENFNNQYRYRYQCCSATPENCETRYTNWEYDGMGNVVYLDRHDVRCPGQQILQQFQMETKAANIRYRYVCCDANRACPNPYDKIERVMTCDARSSSTTLSCQYEKKIGASHTSSQSQGQTITKEISTKLEGSFRDYGISVTTQYDWRVESSDTYSAERTTRASFDCAPGSRCSLDQVVGYCGNSKYRVRSNYYKLSTD